MVRTTFWSAIATAMLTGACGKAPEPSPIVNQPGGTPPPPAATRFTISGQLVEHWFGGTQPLSGVRVRAHLNDVTREAVTDSAGRYVIGDLLAGDVTVRVGDEAYAQPCGAPRGAVADSTFDVHVMSRQRIEANRGFPPTMPVFENGVAGVVYDYGYPKRPLAGIYVSVDHSVGKLNDFGAATWTDAEGRFTFCGLTEEVLLLAQRGRFYYYQQNGSVIVDPRVQFRADIVMPD
jgi:hypothetical protein